MNSPILAPAAVLILWTLVMLVWTAATRLPAMKAKGVDLATVVGGRGQDLEGVLPASIQWKSHNYAHLVEQPTLFYAVVAILALTGADGQTPVLLAWAYVLIRIAHSIVQATFNRVAIRFALFMLSTFALVALALIAAVETLS